MIDNILESNMAFLNIKYIRHKNEIITPNNIFA